MHSLNCSNAPTRTRQKGFSMIEIMVATAILAVLVAIVLPVVQGYVERARRAEAIALIGEMQSSLDRWRAENPTYAVASGAPGFGDFPTAKYYSIALSDATATGYTLTATGLGVQASDAECSQYVLIRADGTETKTPNPADSKCW